MGLQHDLVSPAAYPTLEPRAVEFIETHLSWVFLLPQDVFKVKKPIDLGFVDFRTLAQRKQACEAEVALNRRFSPGVYLGVVPVVRTPLGHAVGGPGPIVDWAVHMRRLDDSRRADRHLDAGTLDGAQVDALAEQVAAFHAVMQTSPRIAEYAQVEAIRKNVFENFAQVEGSVRWVLDDDGARRSPRVSERSEKRAATFCARSQRRGLRACGPSCWRCGGSWAQARARSQSPWAARGVSPSSVATAHASTWLVWMPKRVSTASPFEEPTGPTQRSGCIWR